MRRDGRQNKNSWSSLVKTLGHWLKRQPKATCRKTEQVMQIFFQSLEAGITFPEQFGCSDGISAKDLLNRILLHAWSLYI